MNNRTILHCDLNNFFASVSLLDKPQYKDSYVVIGGDESARSGIVLAKNEKAKAMGVKTAETLWQARNKCPDLVVLPPDFKLYSKYSKLTRAIYERYTDMVEPFSIDECWLDVTGSALLFGSGEEIARRISREVREELGITVSIGVSFNKAFAKLGSDMKKPNGITVISRENFKDKVWPLPASSMLFVGRKTEAKLSAMGIRTIGTLANTDIALLRRVFGKHGETMHAFANGFDCSAVVPATLADEQKSISNAITLPRDINSNEDARRTFILIAENICKQLRAQKKVATNIGIIIKTSEFDMLEHAKKTSAHTQSTMAVADIAYSLFCDFWHWEKPIRMLGIKAYNLYDEDTFQSQIDFEGNSFSNEKHRAVDSKIDAIHKKYGSRTVAHASTVGSSLKRFDDKDKIPGFPKK